MGLRPQASDSSGMWIWGVLLSLLTVLGSSVVPTRGTITGGRDILCNDTCGGFDGICEDGGPGSSDSTCALGTDCADCGPRGTFQRFETLSQAAETLIDDEGVLRGGLVVQDTNLTSLRGLESLTRVYGVLVVQNNTNLTSIAGFDDLTVVDGELAIVGNGRLASLKSLGRLASVSGRLGIVGNDALTALEGLETLRNVDGDLLILENSGLASLAGLEQVGTVNGDLQIVSNDRLTSLRGLDNLARVNGTLAIADNSALSTADGLRHLTSVDNGFEIRRNGGLTGLAGLNNLVSVVGPMEITDNPDLESIAELESLAQVGGGLLIRNNGGLRSITNFPRLAHIGRSDVGESPSDMCFLQEASGLIIVSNPVLNSVERFSALHAVQGDFVISGNPNLNRIILENLSEVTGRTKISLTSPGIRADVVSYDGLPYYAYGCQKRTNLIPNVLPESENGRAFQTKLVLKAGDCLIINVASRYAGFGVVGWMFVASGLLLCYICLTSKSRGWDKTSSQATKEMFVGHIWAFLNVLLDQAFILTTFLVIWDGDGDWVILAIGLASLAAHLAVQFYKTVGVWKGLVSAKVGNDVGLQIPNRCLLQELRNGGQMRFGDWILIFIGILIFEVEIIQYLPWDPAMIKDRIDPKKNGFPHRYFAHVAFVARIMEDLPQVALKTIYLVFLSGWGFWATVIGVLSLTVSIGDLIAEIIHPLLMARSDGQESASVIDEGDVAGEAMNDGDTSRSLL